LGDAANDVEIEQIVSEDMNGAPSYKMTSAVQIRGSIPLSWSQKPAFLNIRPRIKGIYAELHTIGLLLV